MPFPAEGIGYRGAHAVLMREARESQPLPHEAQRELVRKFQAGDTAAGQRIVASNLKFLIKSAYSMRGQGLDITELVSEGAQGLLEAAKLYREGQGTVFLSYAVWQVGAYMRRAVRATGRLVRLPANFQQEAKTIRSGGRVPNQEDKLNAAATPLPWSTPIVPDGSLTLEDVVADPGPSPEQKAEEAMTADLVHRLVADLPQKERVAVTRYFGLDGAERTLREAADGMGISGERVRQLVDEALIRLRIRTRAHTMPMAAAA